MFNISTGIAAVDLDNDGELDLLVANDVDSTVSVFLGNGDGTFRQGLRPDVGGAADPIVVGDFNHDGHPDFATPLRGSSFVSVMLGNGDGSFENPKIFPIGVPSAYFMYIAAADLDGDGNDDLIVSGTDSFSILLGRGDGTFTTSIDYGTSTGPYGIGIGDFNQDRRPDIVLLNSYWRGYDAQSISILLQDPAIKILPEYLSYSFQYVGTPSTAQSVTVTNPGNSNITISSIVTTGDFSETNSCPSSLLPQASCTVNITFTPTTTGLRLGTTIINTDTSIYPAIIHSVGLGTNGLLTLQPLSINFGAGVVGWGIFDQISVTNVGSGPVTFSSIETNDPHNNTFTEGDACQPTLAPQQSCTIYLTFTPFSSGLHTENLILTDDAVGSPQVIPLSGMGEWQPKLLVSTSGSGSGTVISREHHILCGHVCAARYPIGARVTLRAFPRESSLTAWSGCDQVIDLDCTVTMGTNDRNIVALFAPNSGPTPVEPSEVEVESAVIPSTSRTGPGRQSLREPSANPSTPEPASSTAGRVVRR